MRVFLAAIGLALVVTYALRETPGYVEINDPNSRFKGDFQHYVYWTQLVTQGGIQAAYGGTWPETYAVYPPVPLYGFVVLGRMYRHFEDPTFDLDQAKDSLWLSAGFKVIALVWHLLAGLAIYVWVRLAHGPWLAGVAGGLYVANPAALFDVAHWGQPDGAHSLFAVLAIGGLGLNLDVLAWGATALAALAKPQAYAILPLIVLAGLRQARTEQLGLGIGVAAVTSLAVVSPFIVTGHLGELLTLPTAIASAMPFVSADAHNLWWLLIEPRGQNAIAVPDSLRLLGPLSYRAVAGGLVLAAFGLTYWLYWTRRASLAEAAALGALGWFVFTTQAHENHLFFALPLLALAWPERRDLLLVFALLSLTIFFNMALHDQLLLREFGRHPQDSLIKVLQQLNAAINVVCFLVWAVAASLRPARAVVSRSVPQVYDANAAPART